ncbi:MAG TPA: DUF2304 domain-containing protein [Bryobacteraceae bacterium]|nr:DUF2304 domain-containing protein [Bryobacteraceae bacterium]
MDRLLHVSAAICLLLITMVLISVRRSHIRVEYSVTWLAAAGAMLALSLSRPAVEYIRRLFALPDTPLAVFLLGSAVFLVVFFRFTLIISRLRDDNIALAQRVAILEYHLRALTHHES